MTEDVNDPLATATESMIAATSASSGTAVDVLITSTEIELLDVYEGEIDVRLPALPSLQPRVLPTRAKSRWRRFLEAGRRRTFTLVRDFTIDLQGDVLPENLRGTIVIPRQSQAADNSGKQTNIFDGASIPFPWIVSYLSFGVLRPLGILLVGSVVHDFTFEHGYLLVRKNDSKELKKIPVARHDADELLRLITGALNDSRFFSRLAWHAVRLGWWGIPYAGQTRTGEKPVQSTLLAVFSVLAALTFATVLSETLLADLEGLGVQTALLGMAAVVMATIYTWIAIAASRQAKKYKRQA